MDRRFLLASGLAALGTSACSTGTGYRPPPEPAAVGGPDTGPGERFATCGPFATRIPRAFIQASKSSALICRPFWVIWNRLDLPTAIGTVSGDDIPLSGRPAEG